MKKNFILKILIVFLSNFYLSYGQDYWQIQSKLNLVESNSILNDDTDNIQFAKIDYDFFNNELKNLKALNSFNFSKKSLFFLNENKELEEFLIYKSNVLSELISEKYPKIINFKGESKNRDGVRITGTFSPLGINGVITTKETKVYIQPKKNSTNNQHIVYTKNRFSKFNHKRLNCLAEPKKDISSYLKKKKIQSKETTTESRNLKIFRIAISATASYTSFWGDNDDTNGSNKNDAFIAIVSTINRVNEIFETDLAIRLELVSDESLVFSDQKNQPYSNDFSNELQETLNQSIGVSNYDLGHLFAYGNVPDGNSGCIGCVCDNALKGRAYSTHPFIDISGEGFFLNDYFDVDFVAHEIGHQFGAHHTFSYENEGFGVSVEPGSGSTLMGYAGLTSRNDLQNHTDGYLHYKSIEEIEKYLESINCQNEISGTNNKPEVSAGNNNYIPSGTPYELTAVATASGQNNLSFNWEQLDSGTVNTSNYSSDKKTGSLNRSYPPSQKKNRFIPNLNRILANKLIESNPSLNSDWESISTIGRILNWGVTVRDNIVVSNDSISQINQDQKKIFVIDSQPFEILSQTVSTTKWGTGDNQKIVWQVGETYNDPINTKTVSIYLSTDGGRTFPINLISNTPNDGEVYITVPEKIETKEARLKIVADNSIYFSINKANFEIELRDFSFSFDNVEYQICNLDNIIVNFDFLVHNEFNESVNFTLNDPSNSVQYEITPTNTSLNDSKVSIELKDLDKLAYEDYEFSILGESSSSSNTNYFKLKKRNTEQKKPENISPINNSTIDLLSTNLIWKSDENVDDFQVQVSTNTEFDNLIIDKKTNKSELTINNLSSESTYYWRVRSINFCSTSTFSDIFSFSTKKTSCRNIKSTEVPKQLNDAGQFNNGITVSKILVPFNEKVQDINVNLSINHTYLSDLTIYLESPSGERVLLSQKQGGDKKNYINTTFDDDADFFVSESSPPFTGIFKPVESLSKFIGDESYGNWLLIVEDSEIDDTGEIISFGIEICVSGEIIDDDDNDKIPNEVDNCPNVSNPNQLDSNSNGIGDVCDIYNYDNFKIIKKDESCYDKNNGSIQIISKIKENYSVEISSDTGFNKSYNFSDNSIQIENLRSGDYTICITSSNYPDFKRCYSTIIDQPTELEVVSKINYDKETISLNMTGSDIYKIKINDLIFNSNKSYETFKLRKGFNHIEVISPNSCNEIFTENIYISKKSLISPNPVEGKLVIYPGENNIELRIIIFDMNGNILKNKFFNNTNGLKIELDVEDLAPSTYFLRLISESNLENIKFVKK